MDVNNVVLILLIIGTLIFLKCCNEDIIIQNNHTDSFNIESHKICPVMDTPTEYTACIHYPHFNLGFICSVSSKNSISIIQKSFKNVDNIYNIFKKDNRYYLTKEGQIKQEVLLCNHENYKYIIKSIGTKTLYN